MSFELDAFLAGQSPYQLFREDANLPEQAIAKIDPVLDPDFVYNPANHS
ncbi:MAG TPA: hypothetical protein V6D43_00130 [Candidatus Sericytochromatia bacterium]